ncbi:MAG: autotransporter-associated beta strand repeat-containing protein [Luteolibacter sp.]
MTVSFLLSPTVYSGSGSWSNVAGGSWALATNWAGSFIASGSEANAGFSALNLTNDTTVTLDGTKTVGSMVFKDIIPSHNWFLNTGSGGPLTLDTSSGIPTISVFNQTATLNVAIAGTKGLFKDESGMLILAGSNTYTGGTVVAGGTLQITGAGALQGAVTINNGSTLWLNAGGASYGNALSGSGTVQVSAGTGGAQLNGNLGGFTGTLNITSASVGGKVLFANTSQGNAISSAAIVRVQPGGTLFLGLADTSVVFGAALELLGAGNNENLGALRIERGAIWGGPVTLKGNSFIGSESGSGGTILGKIGESGGSFGFTKQGAQTLTLGGENTYSGTTVLSGSGSLIINNASALQNSTLSCTGGTVVFDRNVISHAFTMGGLAGSANIALQDNRSVPVSIDLAVGNNNASTTYSGNLSGAGSLEKIGAGTFTISGKNIYTGSTTVSKGTLRLATVLGLPANLKIMPLGDSITYGSNGSNAGYRGPLYSLLTPTAVNFQYIGTSYFNQGSLPSSPVNQQFHQGLPSYSISDVNNNLDGYDNATFLRYGGSERDPQGGSWFGGITNGRAPMYPDLILMMLGTNDLANPAGVQTRLHDLIEKITTQRPAAMLIVGKITPVPSFSANVTNFNEIVGLEVAGFQAAGKLIYLVDLNTNFPADGLYSDNVHPNDKGYSFMANQWFNAIVAAYSSGGGRIPLNSPTSIATGGLLDLNGMRADLANLSGAGDISLGGGGILFVNNSSESTFSGSISGTGQLVKTGSGALNLTGSIQHFGRTQVSAGTLRVGASISGSTMIEIMSGATLELSGGTLTASTIYIHAGGLLSGNGVINANVVNDGGISGTNGQTLAFGGRVTNSGWIRMSGGAILQAGEDVFNHGSLDLLTGAPVSLENLVNAGTVVDSSQLKVKSISKTPALITLTIQSYTGHGYQLQYSSTLLPGSWQNVEPAQAGVTGNVLGFATAAGNSNHQGFYRFVVTP